MANYAIVLISNIDETMVLLTWYSMLLLERRSLRNVSQWYKELRSRGNTKYSSTGEATFWWYVFLSI